MKAHALLTLPFLLLLTFSSIAENTRLTVRVLAKDAKFIGTSMEGAEITIQDVSSGKTLAKGVTVGGTGETARLVKQPHTRYGDLATEGSAAYKVALDLNAPTEISITARGPLNIGNPRQVSITQWLFPGKHLDQGNGILLELPGFAIQPQPPAEKPRAGKPMELHATIQMMCGCPIEPDGMWDSSGMEFWAAVKHNGEEVLTQPLEFYKTSDFMLRFTPKTKGTYEVTFMGFDPRTANTGLAQLSVEVFPE